ncbi:hypothetical protein D3C83_147570 [compost metagenome]
MDRAPRLIYRFRRGFGYGEFTQDVRGRHQLLDFLDSEIVGLVRHVEISRCEINEV